MSTQTVIWNDPRYRHLFRGAGETIEAEQQLLAQPWRGERAAWFHRVILEICGAAVEEPALT